MVQLDHVSKRFGTVEAVRPLSLTFPSERVTALLGPSGCGKSTLLRLINGLLTPTTGTVRIDGTLLTDATVRTLRHRMGYVIQRGGLFPHLTARANATLLARHLGWAADRIDDRVGELAALVRLDPALLDRFPAQLSGGQQQRVGLIRALFLDPDVLLLDEPLGALDPMIRADVQADLQQIFRELGKTVVLVTHDLTEAGFLGDDVVLLREGRIEQRGSFSDLIERPASDFVYAFVNAQRSPLGALSP